MRRTLLLLVGLNIALQLPWSMHHDIEPHLSLVLAGELVVLAALCGRWPTWGGRLLGAGLFALMLVEVDRIIGVFLLSHDPLFYDQLFLIRHFLVLLSDLWSPWWTLGALGLTGAVAAVSVLLWRAVAVLRQTLPQLPERVWTRAAGVLVAGTLLSAATGWRGPVRWISAELVDNLADSVRIYRGVRAAPEDSPYHALSGMSLNRRPDVRFYVVESYGQILVGNETIRPLWLAESAALQADLTEAGWHMVSSWSVAPVSGGRSWLADASVFLGMPIRYESVYRHLLQRIEPLPDLIEFFDAMDYRTVRLAPSDRARPGIALTNDFRFQEFHSFVDLGYTGPSLGWGLVPDQYSLGYLEENVLPGEPLFLFFHMVSAHIPWESPPPILEDWRDLARLEGEISEDSTALSAEALRQIKRYRRSRRVVRARADDLTLQAYADAVHYDLEVLRRHLRDDLRDGLIIIMGDHQPPIFTRGKTRDSRVPVHVLSRDAALLEAFQEAGFVDGLQPDPQTKATLHHSGLFSLLARALAVCCSDSAPPEYLRKGVRPHP